MKLANPIRSSAPFHKVDPCCVERLQGSVWKGFNFFLSGFMQSTAGIIEKQEKHHPQNPRGWKNERGSCGYRLISRTMAELLAW